jgi:hypothetical protein
MSAVSAVLDVAAETSFIDRRDPHAVGDPQGRERRQFVNSHEELSPDAAELARRDAGDFQIARLLPLEQCIRQTAILRSAEES